MWIKLLEITRRQTHREVYLTNDPVLVTKRSLASWNMILAYVTQKAEGSYIINWPKDKRR
jgi:hypothetical protein